MQRTQFMNKIVFSFFLLLSFSIELSGQKLPKALVLTGNGNIPESIEGYPPWIHEFHTQMVSDMLKDIVVTEVTEDLGVLTPEKLAEYDLIISYGLFLMPDKAQLDALYDFVAGGKQLFTVHCGLLNFLNWDRYEEVMGGIFIGGPSTEPTTFNVSTANMEFWGYDYSFRKPIEHPVSQAVDDFTISDELYFFQPTTPEFYVIARAENHPVMWWHPVEKGRVMCLTLGHGIEAKQEEGYQQLLTNGIRWLLDYPLLKTIPHRYVSKRQLRYNNFLDLEQYLLNDTGKGVTYGAFGNHLVSFTVKGDGKLDLELSGVTGMEKSKVMAKTPNGLSTTKDFGLTVLEDGSGNIASYYGNTAISSSTESKNVLFNAVNVIDGDRTTRWGSGFVDPSWIQVDLQKNYSIGMIKLFWEDSYAKDYYVSVSENGNVWTTVAEVKDSDGGEDVIRLEPLSARYVRVTGTKRSRDIYGYSLFEIEIYAP